MSPARKLSLALTLTACAGFASAPSAIAQQAITIAGPVGNTYSANGDDLTVGFNFKVQSADVLVTSVGYINDGFLSPHNVGIFDASGALVPGTLASVTPDTAVQAPATAPVFTYVALPTPVMLTGGQSYSIGAGIYPGGVFLTGATLVVSPLIAYNGSRYGYGTSTDAFTYPNNPGGDGGDFGPNFLLAPAPEPSAFAALGLGALSLGGLALRARRRQIA